LTPSWEDRNVPQGVNFTNILRAAFLKESFKRRFFCTSSLAIYFLEQENWQKAALKLLVNLTTDQLNFHNFSVSMDRLDMEINPPRDRLTNLFFSHRSQPYKKAIMSLKRTGFSLYFVDNYYGIFML
jgi:hypothetical protein